MVWNFLKKGKKTKTFVSWTKPYGNKTFKYLRYNNLKNWIINTKAAVKNSVKYYIIRNYMINLIFTGLVMWFIICGLTSQSKLLQGFGVAVTIATLQHYVKWYFKMRKE